MELPPDHILNGRFRIVHLLGQGGMGAVYFAYDPVLDRHVAIKQLQPVPATSDREAEQEREQFLREARSLAALHHPNLPRVTDYFIDGDIHYLVMDYVEGQSLQDLLQASRDGLDEDRVLDWADQLLAALEYIHQRSLIHRDIKPANIRLTPDGRIFLVDFGLVKSYSAGDPKTLTLYHSMGTPAYAPPEQLDPAGHTDQRSDIYSLGATLYHLLTGEMPLSVTRRSADPESFRTLREANTNISPDVERVILRAMALERAKRFPGAADMRAALQMIRQARAIDPTRTTYFSNAPTVPVVPPAPPQRSHRRRAVAIAIVPALLAAVLLIGLAAAVQSGLPATAPAVDASATPTPTASQTLTPTPTASLTLEPSPTFTVTPSLTSTRLTTSTPLPTTITAGSLTPQNGGAPAASATPKPKPTARPQTTPPGQEKTPPGKEKTPRSPGNPSNSGGGKKLQ